MCWWWSMTLALWHSCLLSLKTLPGFYGCSFTCSPAVCWSLHLIQSISMGKFFPAPAGSCIRLWLGLILLPIKFLATLLETSVSLLASTSVYVSLCTYSHALLFFIDFSKSVATEFFLTFFFLMQLQKGCRVVFFFKHQKHIISFLPAWF